VGTDVTLGLLPRKVRSESTIHFLPTAECEKILAGAGRYQSAIALSLFAGLRPEEIAGKGKPWLCWEHVQRKERIVHIPAEISKTRRARNLEKLPPAFWVWIESGNGEIAPGRSRQITEHCAKLAGYGKDRPWPHDALRHTFATYAVAATMDPGRVSLWMGHEGNPTTLFRHYRGITTETEAKKFWALRPT
jgi:integrase